MNSKLDRLFYPHSVAIVGASHHVGTVGHSLIKHVLTQGYKGKVYPVNIKGGTILGKPVYTNLSEIPYKIDLVIIAVPALQVASVLTQAGKKGASAAIVISAGFKEIGRESLEKELAQVSKSYNMVMIGPNCLGLINPEIFLNASFASLMPQPGAIAFMSQSGALCSTVLDYAEAMGLGFSKFISVGNKAVIGEKELLEYLYHDPHTRVIMMYVEELNQIQDIIRLAREITRGTPPKPIILLKSGRTEAGSHASQSHTGSLGGGDQAYSALCAQSGIIRVDTISELFDIAEAFSQNHIPKNNNIAVITNAGGPGVLATDALTSDGLNLATLAPATIEKLQQVLPEAANCHNPIDVLGDAQANRYKQALSIVNADPGVDGIILILTPQSMTEIEATAKMIVDHKKNTNKPLIVSFMGQHSVAKATKLLNQGGVMTTHFPEPAAHAFATMNSFRHWLGARHVHGYRFHDVHPTTVKHIIHQAQSQNMEVLDVETSSKLLKAYGFPVLKSKRITTDDQAHQATRYFTHPVALKILSSDISHKSDVGGVALQVPVGSIPSSYKQLLQRVQHAKPHARIEGVQVVEMAPSEGFDLILGMTTDPHMGKLIAVGLGGIYTEVFKDVSWGIAPLTHYDTQRMIKELRSHQVFEGYRGQPPLDIEELRKFLGRLSQLSLRFPEIKEIDINPIRLLPAGKGAKVLDARVVLHMP